MASLLSSVAGVLEAIQNAILIAVMNAFDAFFGLEWIAGDPMIFAGIAILLFVLLSA